MSVFDGLSTIAESASGLILSPLRTAGRIVGTGLEAAGKVVGSLAEGDLRGAANNYVDGVKKQVGNVGQHLKDEGSNLKGLSPATATTP